jgi:internalin A
MIVASLHSTLVQQEARADHRQDKALARLMAFGGAVNLHSCTDQKTSWSQPAKKLSSSDPKTVTFFNTYLNDRDLASLSDALVQIENIKRLDLSNTRVTGESLGMLAGMASLDELDLSHTPISADGLLELRTLTRLKCINLNNTFLPRDSFAGFVSAFAPSLRSLQLSGARVCDPHLQPVGADDVLRMIGQLHALESLALSQTFSGPGTVDLKDGISDLQPLAALCNLTELDLSNNNLAMGAMQTVKTLTNLTALKLAGNKKLNDDGLADLWSSTQAGAQTPIKEGLQQLTKLDLSGTHLTDVGLSEIANHHTQLAELSLSGTLTLVDRDSPALLGKLTKLSKLDISDTGVDDASFRAIWKTDEFHKLVSLDISGTMVTDKGLTTDEPRAVGFAFLETLYCADTKVTTGGVNRRNALNASVAPPQRKSHALGKTNAPTRRFAVTRKDSRMPQ